MVTTLYLVRHAEAEGNAQEFFQGHIDTQLTEKGIAQLDCLAERFRDVKLDAVYASPFQRAYQTAEAVNRYHELEIQKDFQLREINGGRWEGKPWADLPALFPEEHFLWTSQMEQFRAPFGDTMQEVYDRMRQAVTAIAEANSGRTVAVASHGCALRNFLCYVEFGDICRLADVGWADNTAVSKITYENGVFTLVYKSDASHLTPELSTLRGSRWCRYETAKEAAE